MFSLYFKQLISNNSNWIREWMGNELRRLKIDFCSDKKRFTTESMKFCRTSNAVKRLVRSIYMLRHWTASTTERIQLIWRRWRRLMMTGINTRYRIHVLRRRTSSKCESHKYISHRQFPTATMLWREFHTLQSTHINDYGLCMNIFVRIKSNGVTRLCCVMWCDVCCFVVASVCVVVKCIYICLSSSANTSLFNFLCAVFLPVNLLIIRGQGFEVCVQHIVIFSALTKWSN